MTKKDQGKFLTLIKQLGEDPKKGFANVPLSEEINPFNLLSTDTILDNLRDRYNFEFVKCCEQFGVQGIDDIYDALATIWELSYEWKTKSERGAGFFRKLVGCVMLQNLNVRWHWYKNMTRNYAAALAAGKAPEDITEEDLEGENN
jgi:hypothetical protein